MSMRAAANQFGYLLGAAAGGLALAVGGFAALGVVLAALFASGAILHAAGAMREAAGPRDLTLDHTSAAASPKMRAATRPGEADM